MKTTNLVARLVSVMVIRRYVSQLRVIREVMNRRWSIYMYTRVHIDTAR